MATDFYTGTVTVSLNYTHKVLSSQPDSCNFTASRTELNSQLAGSESESESELLYDSRFTVNQFILALLEPHCHQFVQLNPCVTSSLTREWVSRLQLLLVLASAVILGSESRGTYDHVLLFQIRNSPNLEGQIPVFISPTNRATQLYIQAPGSLFIVSYYSQGDVGGIESASTPAWLGRPKCPQDKSPAWTTQKTQLLYCCRCMVTAPLHGNGRGADHIEVSRFQQ
jgi:hypothetical protein